MQQQIYLLLHEKVPIFDLVVMGLPDVIKENHDQDAKKDEVDVMTANKDPNREPSPLATFFVLT